MPYLNVMPLGPLAKAFICPSFVGFRNDRVHELVTRITCLALRVQGISPISVGSLAIRIYGYCLCEPGSGTIEGLAAILRVSRVISLLEFHVSSKQSGLVKCRVKFKRVLIF